MGGSSIDFTALGEQLERVHSGRLALRQPAISDAWPLFSATRNALFNRFLLWDAPEDELETVFRMESIIDACARGRMAAVSAVVKRTGEWIGLFKFQPYAADPRKIEMGVWMHDRFWHGRYALELGRMCVDAAFSLSSVGELVGAASPDNRSSQRLMELCGLQPREHVVRPRENGSTIVLQEFALARDDWSGAARGVSYSHLMPAALPIPPVALLVEQIEVPSGLAVPISKAMHTTAVPTSVPHPATKLETPVPLEAAPH